MIESVIKKLKYRSKNMSEYDHSSIKNIYLNINNLMMYTIAKNRDRKTGFS